MRDSYDLDPRLWTKGRNAIAALTLIGWAATLAGFSYDRAAFYPAYLVSFAFWLTTALGALFFVMLQHVTGAAWSVTTRRVAETFASTVPVAAVLFLPVAFGLPRLYEWARPEAVAADPILQAKQAYLNPQFFVARAALCFAVWSVWALVLYRNSVSQDGAGSLERTRAAARWSAPGLILLSLTVCLAAFDWLMSLDPHWYSTMFGVYVYAGAALAGFAAITLILLGFRRAGVMRQAVNREHYQDLARWMFALTMFWAYIAFCQYLLIWYANLPEETVWYRDRLVGGWRTVAALLLVGHFFVPFFLLMSRGAKRNLGVLAGAAGWILLMHFVDLYWIVMPVFERAGPSPRWMDAASFVAVGGTFALAFWWTLRRHALAPVGDIRFAKALEFTNV